MSKSAYDEFFNIDTSQLRFWSFYEQNQKQYNGLEATSYKTLDLLGENYTFPPSSHMVDFGCGSGRVLVYTHHFAKIPVTGVELHPLTFKELKQNREDYLNAFPDNNWSFNITRSFAERYEIKPSQNVFYFFNPFSIRIFKQVIYNILASYRENRRQMDIIIYYVLPEFESFLDKHTPFEFKQQMSLQLLHSSQVNKVMIYRLYS